MARVEPLARATGEAVVMGIGRLQPWVRVPALESSLACCNAIYALVTSRSAAAGPASSTVAPLGSRAMDTVEKAGGSRVLYARVLSSKGTPQFREHVKEK